MPLGSSREYHRDAGKHYLRLARASVQAAEKTKSCKHKFAYYAAGVNNSSAANTHFAAGELGSEQIHAIQNRLHRVFEDLNRTCIR